MSTPLNRHLIEKHAEQLYARMANDLADAIEAKAKMAVPAGRQPEPFSLRDFSEWLKETAPKEWDDVSEEMFAGHLIAQTGITKDFLETVGIQFQPK